MTARPAAFFPPDYRSPRWLPDGHSQTIYPALLGRRPHVEFRRETWDTPDGDFVDVDWLVAPPASQKAPPAPTDLVETPLVVLFHGLEGSSDSHYARTLMREVEALGWRGVIPHFRSCSGRMNRAPRFYHSGDSTEIDWILRRLRAHVSGPMFAAGVSLGGNVLLRWLGEREADAAQIVTAASAVSAPLDLRAGGLALSHGFNMVYTRNFLGTLKKKALAKLEQYPGLYDRDLMMSARDLGEFDHVVTAPLHGYHSAFDYYTRASSKPILPAIEVPTLVLNARNDPFQPASALPGEADVGRYVHLLQPANGGHVGFMSGPFPGGMTWMPRTVVDYFRQFLPHSPAAPHG
ncbi:alpha/beta hydrolase [Pandoraea pneumonica]|uniref:Alpha/beta hydrolase n=1 Tax=Pandoraea pneumonica TaxID=2508299 RepID=A0A5E4YFQ6_9BURK|nr:alpha/beta fold hydrolase [Pandoraea pneumonica]VVE47571.1 alpha/beta hydrolase [Pandoraea pneumonica]